MNFKDFSLAISNKIDMLAKKKNQELEGKSIEELEEMLGNNT
jgi:hypothetical protein